MCHATLLKIISILYNDLKKDIDKNLHELLWNLIYRQFHQWRKTCVVLHNFTSVIVDRKMEGGPVAVVQHHKSKEESLTQR